MKTFEEWQDAYTDLRGSALYMKLPRVKETEEKDHALAAQIQAIIDEETYLQIEPLISEMALLYEDLGFETGYYLAVLLQETGGTMA